MTDRIAGEGSFFSSDRKLNRRLAKRLERQLHKVVLARIVLIMP